MGKEPQFCNGFCDSSNQNIVLQRHHIPCCPWCPTPKAFGLSVLWINKKDNCGDKGSIASLLILGYTDRKGYETSPETHHRSVQKAVLMPGLLCWTDNSSKTAHQKLFSACDLVVSFILPVVTRQEHFYPQIHFSYAHNCGSAGESPCIHRDVICSWKEHGGPSWP